MVAIQTTSIRNYLEVLDPAGFTLTGWINYMDNLVKNLGLNREVCDLTRLGTLHYLTYKAPYIKDGYKYTGVIYDEEVPF